MTTAEAGVTGSIASRRAPAASRTGPEVQRSAEELVPLLREHAAETDELRAIPDHVFRALQDAGLFHILKPRRYGGFELTEHDHAMVALTLARGCASTAWVFAILSSDNIAVLSYPEETQDEIWGTNTYATLAGNTTVDPDAVVRRVDGGYRLTGQWGFCSGSDFSEWLVFHAPVGEGREGHMFLVPSHEAETIDDWFPTGLRGTGSRSKRVTDVFVPDRRVMRDRGHRDAPGRAARAAPDVRRDVLAVAVTRALHVLGLRRRGGARRRRVVRGAQPVDHAGRQRDGRRGAPGRSGLRRDRVRGRCGGAGDGGAGRRAAQRRGGCARGAATRTRRSPCSRRSTATTPSSRAWRCGPWAACMRSSAPRPGTPEHPVSRAKRDVELVAAHVTLNWRQAAVRYLASVGS